MSDQGKYHGDYGNKYGEAYNIYDKLKKHVDVIKKHKLQEKKDDVGKIIDEDEVVEEKQCVTINKDAVQKKYRVKE